MRLVLLAPVAVLCACATAYHPMGFSGGYADWPAGKGQHHVEVSVNGWTDSITARSYFTRRAVELCAADGFNSYSGESQTRVTGNGSIVYGDVVCLNR